MDKKKILFIIGSVNQTSQMHQISSFLPEYDCYFTQFFDDNPVVKFMLKVGIMEQTILSGHFKRNSEEYLLKHNLKNDYRMEIFNHKYDMVVMCTDMVFVDRIKNCKTVWVQEGMTDPLNRWSKFVRKTGLHPAFTLSTSLNGSLNRADIYCAGSLGYKEKFIKQGTDGERIVVTGIPNFDNYQQYLDNDFPHKNYVFVATSDIRECAGFDNRKKFIKNSVKIANGRKMIFKLHPNEIQKRAISEIKKYGPSDALIFTSGNTNHMIANCDVLITQYSTVSYIGLGLGKEVHSYFDVNELKQLSPMQNNGTSAQRIAAVCRRYLEFNGNKKEFYKEINKCQAIYNDLAIAN